MMFVANAKRGQGPGSKTPEPGKVAPRLKRLTEDDAFWAGIDIPIQVLMQQVQLQEVIEARQPEGGLAEERIRDWVVGSVNSVPTAKNLRERYSSLELEEMERSLEASTKANTKALVDGFRDQVHKFFTNRRIREAEQNLPQLRHLGVLPAKAVRLLGVSATEEDLRRHNASAEAEVAGPPERMLLYPPERPWELKRAIAKAAGFTGGERSVKKFKAAKVANHVDLETVVEGALKTAAIRGNKTT